MLVVDAQLAYLQGCSLLASWLDAASLTQSHA